jgi:lipopolysaccharide/colanic/teichoic acid biosynthesis glycosyltransferase
MNIVGPRPERPAIVRDLREEIEDYRTRHRALPGITGLAQINHHYDRCLDDVRTKVTYDLEYIRRQSLWEDLKIMVKTVPVMLFRRGGW